jgi:hypothetical protein
MYRNVTNFCLFYWKSLLDRTLIQSYLMGAKYPLILNCTFDTLSEFIVKKEKKKKKKKKREINRGSKRDLEREKNIEAVQP